MFAAPGCRRIAFALLVACVAPLNAASAQEPPRPFAALKGAPIKPAGPPGTWIVGEWRESEVALAPFGFRLSLAWNGIDDAEWPFERIVAGLASAWCGRVTSDTVQRRVAELYRQRSLTPEKDLGGNGGVSFKKRLTADLGECRAEFLAEGARWHKLNVIVFRP